MTAPLIAAVDGGGSKTVLVVARHDGTPVLTRRTGGSNPYDQPRWREVLADLLADLPPGLVAASAGLAGHGEGRTLGTAQHATLSAAFPCPVTVSNDVDMACTGAFAGRPGVLLLSGTGSMAWASDGANHTVRVGGWGSLFGDEGSAYRIGCDALSLLTTTLDGRTGHHDFATALATAMDLPAEPVACRAALPEWFGALPHPRSAIAGLARIVGQLADDGSPEAAHIIDRATEHLAVHVETARRLLAEKTGIDQPLPWSYGGGTLQNIRLRNAIAARSGPPVAPQLPPIGGGLVRAARQAGWQTDAAWTARLAASL